MIKINIEDKIYPKHLKTIKDAPKELYLEGNTDLLNEQIKKFQPKSVCVSSHPENIVGCNKVLSGTEGLEQICSNKENDIILVAVSGKIGLRPTITAIKNGINIALANKGYFQILTKDGIQLTRDGRFKMNKNGEILTLDSTFCKVHRHGLGARKNALEHETKQDIASARGGKTTKIHVLIDEKFHLVKFLLSAGNVNDNRVALPLLQGAVVCIPDKVNAKVKHEFDEEL